MSDLGELFAKDPLVSVWTDADVEMAIEYYRAHRHQFDLIKKDGSVKRRRTTKAKPVQLDLEELLKERSR